MCVKTLDPIKVIDHCIANGSPMKMPPTEQQRPYLKAPLLDNVCRSAVDPH